MIFLIVGTQKFPMDRLLRAVDEDIAAGLITEEVFAQSGHCTYQPAHYKTQAFLSHAQMEETIEKARMVIVHSGVGSILLALQKNKPVIVYPRLKKYGEHVDDHQTEIANAFAQKGFVLCCNEGDPLPNLIAQCASHTFAHYTPQTHNMISLIENYITESSAK